MTSTPDGGFLFDVSSSSAEKNKRKNGPPPNSQLDMEGQTGFCIKTRDTVSDRKLFVNITHNPGVEMPGMLLAPEELAHLLSTEAIEEYTIPMIVKSLHYTRDKSGDE